MSPEREDAFYDLVMVCPHLGEGGAQRVLAALANAWARQGRRIAVVTLFAESPRHSLDPSVRLENVHGRLFTPQPSRRRSDPDDRRVTNAAAEGHSPAATPRPAARRGLRARAGSFLYFARVIPALRTTLQMLPATTTVAFVGETNLITLLAGVGLGRRIVISERNDPGRERLHGAWELLRPLLYRRAHRVTANTRHALDHMARYVPARKLSLVRNPLWLREQPKPHVAQSGGPRVLLAVGRLHPQKGFDVLLRAFAALPPHLACWNLWIAGTGDARADLQQLAAELHVSERVRWLGFVESVETLYRAADLFVQPSRYEGMSNALLEAMASGLPVIATDTCPGALELVVDGETGRIAPGESPAGLATTMEELMDSPSRRRTLGDAARSRSRAFRLERVLPEWEEVLGLRRSVAVDGTEAGGGRSH